MKKQHKHILLVIGLALGAWLIYEIFSFFSAVEAKAEGVTADVSGFFAWIVSAPAKAAQAVASLFTGGSTDPNAPDPDADGATNIDGSPITNAQAGAAQFSNLVGGVSALNNPNNTGGYFE